MSNAKKCDRCGKLYEERRIYPRPQIKIIDEYSETCQRAYMDLQDLDLCQNCKNSFFKWLKGAEE